MHLPQRTCTALTWLALCAFALPTHAAKRDKTSDYVPPTGHRLVACSGTGSKPQSKLWYDGSSFWCILDTPEGNRILQLVDHEWRVRQPLANPPLEGECDVLWDGQSLVVVVHDDISWLLEFDFDPATRRYVGRSGYPLRLDLAPDSETLVIDEDSTGRLWIAYSSDGTVYVAHSLTDHLHWNLPGQVVRDGVDDDDISALIAFDGQVGVFWSDQERDEFGFRLRADQDDPEAWGPVEVVLAEPGCADDHVHLAADHAGRVYAATKDDDNRLQVHMRSPTGEWTSHRDVLGSDVTRPIIMTAEADTLLVMLCTRWHQGLDTIEISSAPLGTLDFSSPSNFISVPAVHLNNVTGLKRSLPAGQVMAIATGADTAWWNVWAPAADAVEETWPLQAVRVTPCTTAVLALPFDEGSGSVTADVAGGGHGILGGPWARDFAEPTWIEGVSGHALRFDGQHQFVSVTAGSSFAVHGSMTMECWFRSWPVMAKQVLLSGDNFYLHLQYNGEPKFSWDEVRGKNHTVEIQQSASDTLWHHLAYVYDEPRQESRLYLDGRLGGAEPDSQRVIQDPGSFFVGMRLNDRVTSNFFQGDIDQVQITAAARYMEDFVPQRAFDATGASMTFLQWTPFSNRGKESYIVYRRAGTELEPLHARARTDTWFYDRDAPEGSAHYEIEIQRPGLPAVRSRLDWSPAHPATSSH